MFAKYGYFTIIKIILILLVISILSIFIPNIFIKSFILILSFFFFIFTLYFFRDPERIPPDKDNIIVSPADGRIIFVKDVVDDKFINDNAKQISIFMSPFNVHVNRIPKSGIIDYLEYHNGKYIAAFKDKASLENERAEFGITTNTGKILFTQVAGFIARRIVYDLHKGDIVEIGKRFGMIKFGSRVDVIVPSKWTEKVKSGDKVVAGKTILFELNL